MHGISRRDLLTATAFGAVLSSAARAGAAKFEVESDRQNVRSFQGIHAGLGSIDVRIFDFSGAAAPANFLIYDIPVGASEGVHLHDLTDPKLGAFDEYYYILEGRGKMLIDGEPLVVSAGDHIHTPLNVAHGIENVDEHHRLKVFLTYIDRSAKSQESAGVHHPAGTAVASCRNF
jgi:mannose-6-phosphate isomerase-like protein (cupin superfamily)